MNLTMVIWFHYIAVCYVLSLLMSMMTGDDSPTANRKEEFHFGRSTPPPTTSYFPKHEHADIKTVAEPNKEEKDKEKDKEEKDDVDISRPDANPEYKPNEKRENNERKDGGGGDKGGDRGDKRKDKKDVGKGKGSGDNDEKEEESSDKKCNGDRLDGRWIPSDAKAPPSDDEDDSNCTVKCLYYTMQCCECTIS
ncbi:cylicin-2-like isoform X2 [Onthophagus taurus]|uniref:cylicin-2-like isoform X2 n=1 Tax=Onthophagus taurus TaxID=166361 RepID=UPI0039BEB5D7